MPLIEINVNFSLKPGSQYIVCDASRQKIITFSMGTVAARCRNEIEFYSCVVMHPNPIEKITTSGRDASCTIYCEAGGFSQRVRLASNLDS